MRLIFSVILREKEARISSLDGIDESSDIMSKFGKKDGYIRECGIHQQAPLLPTLPIVSFPQTVRRCKV